MILFREEALYRLAWSPDSATLAIGCNEGAIVLFQPASKTRRVVKGPLGGALLVAFDRSGRFLLSYSLSGGRGILWDVANAGAELRFSLLELPPKGPALKGSEASLWWQGALDGLHQTLFSVLPEDNVSHSLTMAVHPGGRLVAIHVSDGIVLGDLGTGQRVGSLPVGKGTALHFDAAGNLYGYINYQHYCWPITTDGNRFKIGQPERLNLPAGYSNMDITADGRFVAQAMYDAGSVVLDRQTGKTTRLSERQKDVRWAAVHPNGSLVASFSWSAKGFRLWETKTGQILHAHDQGNTGFGRFTPDGKYLVTTAGGTPEILLWSVPDCKLVRKLGACAPFAISPDSRYIAAAEAAGKVRLTRIDNGELIARFDAPGEDYLLKTNFSPDGRYLFGLNIEQTKHHVWDLWKLRRQLAELKLDWETTPAPEAPLVRESIVVEVAAPQPK